MILYIISNHWNLVILCNLGEDVDSNTKRPCILLLDSLQIIEGDTEPMIRKYVLPCKVYMYLNILYIKLLFLIFSINGNSLDFCWIYMQTKSEKRVKTASKTFPLKRQKSPSSKMAADVDIMFYTIYTGF